MGTGFPALNDLIWWFLDPFCPGVPRFWSKRFHVFAGNRFQWLPSGNQTRFAGKSLEWEMFFRVFPLECTLVLGYPSHFEGFNLCNTTILKGPIYVPTKSGHVRRDRSHGPRLAGSQARPRGRGGARLGPANGIHHGRLTNGDCRALHTGDSRRVMYSVSVGVVHVLCACAQVQSTVMCFSYRSL